MTLPIKSNRKKVEKEISIDLKRERDFPWLTEQIRRDFQHKKKTAMPVEAKPMLASITDEPFNDADWQFEIKWDGYRALAYLKNGKADLRSRNNQSFNKKYPSLLAALKEWPVNAVIDGEIVILSEDGKADFAALQAWEKAPQGQLLFYVFDILWLEGIDLQNEPLSARREVLRKILPDNSAIRFSDSIDEYGNDFFKAAKDSGLEGIIAKRKNSLYKTNSRTKDWYKIKAETRHEAIICGYTKKTGTDRDFSSLLLGIPDRNGFRYIGQVGTGFTEGLQKEILNKLAPLTTNKNPFDEEPLTNSFVQWVRPKILCEVKYTELTASGVMRHASFQGLREDKSVSDYNALEEKTGNIVAGSHQLVSKKNEAEIVSVDSHELKFTNLSKIYWPKERLTKGDMLNYYSHMAPYILPYMLNRPQSLNRFPNGIKGESFYQKNMKGKVDKWLTTFERFSESDGESKDFLVCTNTASLLYMANLGCIEMNPWHSRIQSPHYPDWCVIDLDPGNISFEKVIQTAQTIHRILNGLNIPSYPKTSGSTGIHIYIPLGAKYNYEQSKQFAELIANLAHQELPSFTSLVRNPEKRKTKIYIDYLQNRPIQTICAPYSVRPKPGATVSAPLHWDEVKKGLKMSSFTIKTIAERVKTEGDLFEGVLGKGIQLNDVLQQMSTML